MPTRKVLQIVAGRGGLSVGTAASATDWAATDQMRLLIGEATSAVKRLTPRQRQVLSGILRGDSNKQIARDLGISPRTVEIHRGHMLDRLDARTTADAVRIGIYAELGMREF